eukprot:CAMPEP_0178520100 /NCGR_PEP_ID=MMETSP0696-20121128/27212_1 /TAXON_ID=265572 /ORGANISM="Extubocellulus spinifer, Strain CCMP396" /LENGTH=144 /DNA_ID=CAMNT_0020150911 /DNA_START=64 /DNA_END=498 /DNA_ORIENTATION=-
MAGFAPFGEEHAAINLLLNATTTWISVFGDECKILADAGVGFMQLMMRQLRTSVLATRAPTAQEGLYRIGFEVISSCGGAYWCFAGAITVIGEVCDTSRLAFPGRGLLCSYDHHIFRGCQMARPPEFDRLQNMANLLSVHLTDV